MNRCRRADKPARKIIGEIHREVASDGSVQMSFETK
jgi:hypothetical protein